MRQKFGRTTKIIYLCNANAKCMTQNIHIAFGKERWVSG